MSAIFFESFKHFYMPKSSIQVPFFKVDSNWLELLNFGGSRVDIDPAFADHPTGELGDERGRIVDGDGRQLGVGAALEPV